MSTLRLIAKTNDLQIQLAASERYAEMLAAQVRGLIANLANVEAGAGIIAIRHENTRLEQKLREAASVERTLRSELAVNRNALESISQTLAEYKARLV